MSPGELSQEEIDALLSRATERARRATEARLSGPEPRAAVPTARAAPARAAKAEPDEGAFEQLLDVPLEVRVRLGEAELPVEDLLGLAEGSVVELDRAPGDPADILVNDRLVARGEIVVVDERFTVRVTEIVSPGSGGEGGQ
jgi:flagellar motor switch protein FliN/FliY